MKLKFVLIYSAAIFTLATPAHAGYVGNDPINFTDPFGMAACPSGEENCIDDPETETGTEEQPITDEERRLDTVVVTARRTKKYSDGSRIRLNRLPEQAFTVTEDGVNPIEAYQQVRQDCEDGSARVGLRLDLAAFGGNAGGHTHPDRRTGVSGLPGPEDGGLARALGGSNYVISGRGAFAIDSTAVGFRVRQVAGRGLSGRERRQVQGIVSRYNQHQGGSGVKCTTTVIR